MNVLFVKIKYQYYRIVFIKSYHVSIKLLNMAKKFQTHNFFFFVRAFDELYTVKTKRVMTVQKGYVNLTLNNAQRTVSLYVPIYYINVSGQQKLHSS